MIWMRRRLLLPGLVSLLSGCGYFTAETWDDDPETWTATFQSKKPDAMMQTGEVSLTYDRS